MYVHYGCVFTFDEQLGSEFLNVARDLAPVKALIYKENKLYIQFYNADTDVYVLDLPEKRSR